MTQSISLTQPKTTNWTFWIVTILLSLGMFIGGAFQAFQHPITIAGFRHLGYPTYFMSIIGTWKMLGIIAILIPGFPLLKEWAYAGLFFVMTGALLSHIFSGDRFYEMIAPLIFVMLIMISWRLRPASRRLTLSE